MSEANVIETQAVNEAPPLEALLGWALDVIPTYLATDGSGDKRIRPNAVLYALYSAEDRGLIVQVPATAEHIANGAKCKIGDAVWVLADCLKEYAA